jgi:anti-anti-sigma factor
VGAVIEKVGPRVYRLIGDLDASNVGDVDAVLEADLPSDDDLTLDLSELTFVDSMGISLLVATAGKLGRGRLILRSPDSSVRRILELVQLDQRPNVMVAPGEAGASDG